MDGYDPTKVPVEMPPPGKIIDFSGGPTSAWMPRVAIYTTLPVALTFLALRAYTRLRARIPFGLDDCEHCNMFGQLLTVY